MNPATPTPADALPRHDASDYMHWAKTLQVARFNLGNSGVAAVTLRELGAGLDDIELSGPSFYGWPPLVEALARHLGVSTDRVCHAEGTSLANYLAMAVTLRPGNEVLIEEPTYELLVDAARHLGATVVRFPRPRALGFQPDLDALASRIGPRTRLIVLSDLHNPSSARLAPGCASRIADLAEAAGARVLIDEVYLDAAAVPPPPTAHRADPRLVTTGSLTKVYGLSG
ncbi:MAG: aminotransferase class I/II-fold pyridoxal phosphate-dependent enzyme, partial [Verrucomicrobia bacterium]|nr:aminotransferase class I/II-fold pyridoxal phosphate-dependent enzyme [Verrucomicrobiota bacterium]